MNGLNVFTKSLPMLLVLTTGACSEPSKEVILPLLKAHIENKEPENWCLPLLMLKSARNKMNIGAMFMEQTLDDKNQKDPAVSTAVFPLIFQAGHEDAMVHWHPTDALVMALLIGGNYIVVHEGENRSNQNGTVTPGQTEEQVLALINRIEENGAVVELTAKGLQDGVWDPENGFCAQGFWQLDKLTGWTEASTDNNGKIVTHIEAIERFQPTSLGAAKTNFNPMNFTFPSDTQEFVAAKFNDGWRLISGN